jgi:sec-independent protein translocase protein TatA
MFGLGFQELLVVLVIALLFFGGNKLPEVGSALGKAIREFKRATTEPETIEVKPLATSDHHSPKEAIEEDQHVRT